MRENPILKIGSDERPDEIRLMKVMKNSKSLRSIEADARQWEDIIKAYKKTGNPGIMWDVSRNSYK